jgi:hypothetical protein
LGNLRSRLGRRRICFAGGHGSRVSQGGAEAIEFVTTLVRKATPLKLYYRTIMPIVKKILALRVHGMSDELRESKPRVF